MTALAIVAVVLFAGGTFMAVALCRAAADGDRMIDRLHDTEGDG